jgi:hypothetical protein
VHQTTIQAGSSMPSHPEVRHFKNGLSMVSQWTGGEHKEMEKVFACLVAGHAADPRCHPHGKRSD